MLVWLMDGRYPLLRLCQTTYIVLCKHPPTVAPADIVRTLKSISAVGIFTRFPQLKGKKFWGTGLWSKGYYVGTVGDMSEDVVCKYIDSQHEKG